MYIKWNGHFLAIVNLLLDLTVLIHSLSTRNDNRYSVPVCYFPSGELLPVSSQRRTP